MKSFQDIFFRMCGFGAVSCSILKQRSVELRMGHSLMRTNTAPAGFGITLLLSISDPWKALSSDKFASLPPLKGGTWWGGFLQHSFTFPSCAPEQNLDKNLSRFILQNGKVRCKFSLLRNPITLQWWTF